MSFFYNCATWTSKFSIKFYIEYLWMQRKIFFLTKYIYQNEKLFGELLHHLSIHIYLLGRQKLFSLYEVFLVDPKYIITNNNLLFEPEC